MFERLKKLGREISIPHWLMQGHEPLFSVRENCSAEVIRLQSTIDFFIDLQKDLRDLEGKNEEQIIREKWQALKIDTILERYYLTISKLKEVIENTPERPDNEEYVVEYYTGPRDDL